MNDDLRGQLRDLTNDLREELRDRWKRDLPLSELVSDRWQRARDLGFGEDSSIYATSYVYGDVRVGRSVWIGPLTLLDGTGGLEIGDHAMISAGVQIYTHDTVRRTLTAGVAPIDQAPVSIGRATYVGANATILRGVTIGDHVVIGAGAVVNRDIPSWTVAVGVPCRPIGKVSLTDDGEVALIYD